MDGVSFEVAPKTSLAITGPSGSGKTTLLALIGGMLPRQGGDLCCVDARGQQRMTAEVAVWVPQTVSLLPDRSVLDNVRLGAYLDGQTRGEASLRAADALREVGLLPHASQRAGDLSGGEAQRVAIARAIASARPLILADEPTGQLDAKTTLSVLDALFETAARTIVLVTHDTSAANRCQQVLYLEDGQVIASEQSSP